MGYHQVLQVILGTIIKNINAVKSILSIGKLPEVV